MIQLVFPAQDDEAELQSEAQNISREFQTLRDDVIAQYGYERFRSRRAAAGAAASSTQELFTSRTRMQCDSESHDNGICNILERWSKSETRSPRRVCVCVFQMWWTRASSDAPIGSAKGGRSV